VTVYNKIKKYGLHREGTGDGAAEAAGAAGIRR
jgi:hypothetical protein